MNPSTTQSNGSRDTAFDVKGGPALLSAATITGDEVRNLQDEKLGAIQDIMLDIQTGRIRYAVVSSGGFLGMAERLFAVPWNALKQDKAHQCFVLDATLESLEESPGFDKGDWPNMADERWHSTVESYHVTRADSPRT